jgi:hypothetical protein
VEEAIGTLSKCLLASGGLDKICEKNLQEDVTRRNQQMNNLGIK